MRRQNVATAVVAESGVSVTTKHIGGGIYKTTATIPSSTLVVGNAALAGGKKLFTFPKCVLFIHKGWVDVTMVSTADNTAQTNALDMGAGTTLGVGANAVLSGTTGGNAVTAEDIFDGQTTAALTGATAKNYKLGFNGEVDLKDGTGTAKAFNFNFAGTFTAIETITYSGSITVFWSMID